ncbi:MAG: hypothetical protein N2747_10085 [Chitinophagaceae bacterium]|nr:hypothetical protein [Chitinophagaceae bacterium]
MNPLRLLTALCFPLFFLSAVLPAPFVYAQNEYQLVKYSLPSGWTSQDISDARYFFPENARDKKNLAVAIIPSFKSKDNKAPEQFEQYLKARIRSDETLLGMSEIKQHPSSCSDQKILMAFLKVQTAAGVADRIYFAFPAEGKWGVLAIVNSQENLIQKYNKELSQFVSPCLKTDLWSTYSALSKNIKNQTAPAAVQTGRTATGPVTAPGANPIRAMYVANIMRMVPNTYGFGYTYRNFNTFWVILNNGKVYFGPPPPNPSDFDYESACRKEDACATYTDKGSSIVFTWKNIPVSLPDGSSIIKLKPAYSGQTGQTIFKKIAAENNLRLEGAFSRKTFVDISSSVTSGNVSGETVFVFSRDGRFSIYGFSGFSATSKGTPMGSVQSPGAITPPPPPANVNVGRSSENFRYGTYEIRNNQLILTFSDGKREQYFFFRYPGEENSVIAIGGVNYIK